MFRSVGREGSRRLLFRRALHAALVYLAVGLVWILVSDSLLSAAVSDAHLLVRLQTAKGWLFVLLSAGVIYALVGYEIRELQESERRFRALVEQTLTGVGVVQGGRFTYANPKFADMFGTGVRELLRLPQAEEGFVEAHRAHFRALLSRAMLGEGNARPDKRLGDSRARLWTSCGENGERPVEVSVQAISWGGRPAAIVVMLDRADQEILEEQLRHSQRMEALGQLTGTIAHDFNNLLTAVVAPLEIVAQELEDGDAIHRDVSEALQAAKSATHLTRQLLTFSRKRVSRVRLIDPHSVLLHLRDMMQRLVGERITLKIELGAVTGAVLIDPSHFEQVIVNLVVNARDAMRDGGTLAIRTREVEGSPDLLRHREGERPGAHVLIEVVDTGEGMDAATRDKAFEPFFTTKSGGTGLGLSTVLGIIRQAQGFVRIDSELGAGTCIQVYLPRCEEAPEPATSAVEVAPPLGTSSSKTEERTILVVEDDPAVQRVFERVLSRAGFRVLSAGDAEAALDLVNSTATQIHLVITDLMLPGMDGVALGAEFRRHHPSVPILYSSGYSEEEIIRRLQASPALRFIEKPFQVAQLMETVNQALAESPASSNRRN